MRAPDNDGWVWLEPAVLLAVHDEQLLEHNGAPGLRDEGLLESALVRPRHFASCGDLDAAALAAAYGFTLARNAPFTDGNKRTSFAAVELFLAMNGLHLMASDTDGLLTMLALPAGS